MTHRSTLCLLKTVGAGSRGADSGGHFVAGLVEDAGQDGAVLTLPKFIFGMFLVVLAVSIWTAIDGYSLSAVVLRAIVCALVLQVGYFAYVLVMVGKQSPEVASVKRREPAEDAFPAEHRNLPH